MDPRQKKDKLIAQWNLPSAATLGSGVRARGILLEVRSRLSLATRKRLDIEAGLLVLRGPEDDDHDFRDVIEIVENTLTGIEDLPVIPREVEDILAITSTERHRWLKDGRLQSAGTRTVKLRGRARKITFHVFDPRHIEDVLDQDLVSAWQEQDAVAAAESRRRAAGKAARTRAGKPTQTAASGAETRDSISTRLKGWEDFDLEGLLR
ncbi:hypothetical protein [Arvimicrobium flavum]|uniref:hypothetical protein n=1 Tax=Arvimicrobium flavum TaxID=3393320 RepID=UPI00237B8713|nr:hypothetical protein [Mesorhizobium shangrilense]